MGSRPRPCPGPITTSHKFTEDEISASKKTINSTTSFPCNLPKSVGPCTKSLHRYYYDLVTQTCKPFVFGGCRGNANNFITLQDCNEKCKPSILTSESSLSSSTLAGNGTGGSNHVCALPRKEVTIPQGRNFSSGWAEYKEIKCNIEKFF